MNKQHYEGAFINNCQILGINEFFFMFFRLGSRVTKLKNKVVSILGGFPQGRGRFYNMVAEEKIARMIKITF